MRPMIFTNDKGKSALICQLCGNEMNKSEFEQWGCCKKCEDASQEVETISHCQYCFGELDPDVDPDGHHDRCIKLHDEQFLSAE